MKIIVTAKAKKKGITIDGIRAQVITRVQKMKRAGQTVTLLAITDVIVFDGETRICTTTAYINLLGRTERSMSYL